MFGFQKKDIIKNKDDYYGYFVDKVFELQYDAINKRISGADFINNSRKLYDALPREEKISN